MAIQEIKKRNISEQVFEQLRAQIVSGEWKPGDRLPSENALCSMLGVSRVSIRSALSKLASLGLVVSRQGEGTFVCDADSSQVLSALLSTLTITPEDITLFSEFRRVLECECAHIAASRITPEQIQRLYQYVERFESSSEDPAILAQYDLAFHREIVAATNNKILMQVFEFTQEYLTTALIMNVLTIGTASGIYYHRAIADALANHAPDLARTLMLEHLVRSEEGLKQSQASESPAP